MITYYMDCDAAGGGDGSAGTPYDSISACEAARNTANGQGGTGSYTDIVRYLCSASSGGKDTSATVDGGAQTSAYYLLMQAADGHRATAKWDASKYGVEVANPASPALELRDDYVRVDGLQLRVTSVSANNFSSLGVSAQTSTNRIDITNCLVLGPDGSTGAYTYTCIGIGDSDANVNIINCVARRYGETGSGRMAIQANCATLTLYNCTLIGGQAALEARGATVATVRNTYAGDASSSDFYRRDTATLNKVNCASEDGTADDTDAYTTASNCLVNVPLDATTFLDPLNATILDRDWHLAGTGSDLYGAGVAPGGSDPLNYTTDIDGDTIGVGSRYDIGADWFYEPLQSFPFFATRMAAWFVHLRR